MKTYKNRFVSPFLLLIEIHSLTLCIHTDASDIHLAVCVTQCAEIDLQTAPQNQFHHPLTILNCIFSDREVRWYTYEREVFSVVQAFRKLDYLLTCEKSTRVFTNHWYLLPRSTRQPWNLLLEGIKFSTSSAGPSFLAHTRTASNMCQKTLTLGRTYDQVDAGVSKSTSHPSCCLQNSVQCGANISDFSGIFLAISYRNRKGSDNTFLICALHCVQRKWWPPLDKRSNMDPRRLPRSETPDSHYRACQRCRPPGRRLNLTCPT